MNDECRMPSAEKMAKHEARSRGVSCLRASCFGLRASFVIRHSSFALLLAFASSLLAMSGTTQVAWPGKPVMAVPDWPAGTEAFLNDPRRTEGWNPWFTEWPNDVNHYCFRLQSSNDVNEVLAKLGAIKSPGATILLSAEAEPRGLGFSTVLPASNRIAAVFAIGSQRQIDEWYQRLPEGTPGVRKFGVHTFHEAPKATPPTLTLYVAHPAVVLDALRIPANIQVRATKLARDDADPERRKCAALIDEFVARTRPATSTRSPRRGTLRRVALSSCPTEDRSS